MSCAPRESFEFQGSLTDDHVMCAKGSFWVPGIIATTDDHGPCVQDSVQKMQAKPQTCSWCIEIVQDSTDRRCKLSQEPPLGAMKLC
jgi:hypothetical protein